MNEEKETERSRVATESPHKRKTGLARVWSAWFHSLDGLRAAFRHEDAFRQEVLLAAILIPAAFLLHSAGAGRALMVGSVLLVLVVELLNSAVEAAVDPRPSRATPLPSAPRTSGAPRCFSRLSTSR